MNAAAGTVRRDEFCCCLAIMEDESQLEVPVSLIARSRALALPSSGRSPAFSTKTSARPASASSKAADTVSEEVSNDAHAESFRAYVWHGRSASMRCV